MAVPKGALIAVVVVAGALVATVSLVLITRKSAERPAVAPPTPTATTTPTPQTAALEERAVDGGFSFAVLQGRCGYVNVVSPEQTLPAKGTICLVAADVRNRSDTPRSLDPSCQFLIDRRGNRYTQRTEAWMLDEFSVDAFQKQIPAGGLAETVGFFYDAPKGTKAAAIELHGECGTPGIVVEL